MKRSSEGTRLRRRIGSRCALCVAVIGLVIGPIFSHVAFGKAPSDILDCSIYETKSMDLTVAFQVGQFIFKVGPEVSFSRKTGMAWDKIVHGTIARYVELCKPYNAGMVSKVEYESRLKEIEGLYKETQELEAKLYAATRQRAREAGDELDETLRHSHRTTTTKAGLETSVEALADRVEHLELVGQPLKPAPPCPAPDMLGAPGMQQDPGRNC